MASLWKLPVVYVCENNLYNEYTHYSETTAGDISARANSFGIPTEEADGQDVYEVYAATSRAVARARDGEGPGFLLFHTYRYHGHHVGDVDRAYYRSKEEEGSWQGERDPLKLHTDRLVADGVDEAELEQVATRVRTGGRGGGSACPRGVLPRSERGDEARLRLVSSRSRRSTPERGRSRSPRRSTRPWRRSFAATRLSSSWARTWRRPGRRSR